MELQWVECLVTASYEHGTVEHKRKTLTDFKMQGLSARRKQMATSGPRKGSKQDNHDQTFVLHLAGKLSFYSYSQIIHTFVCQCHVMSQRSFLISVSFFVYVCEHKCNDMHSGWGSLYPVEVVKFGGKYLYILGHISSSWESLLNWLKFVS